MESLTNMEMLILKNLTKQDLFGLMLILGKLFGLTKKKPLTVVVEKMLRKMEL